MAPGTRLLHLGKATTLKGMGLHSNCQGCSSAPAVFHVWIYATRHALPETRDLCLACRDAAREDNHSVSWRQLED